MPLRLTIVQPTLAAYRAPVFARLALVPDIDLHVVYASTPQLKNVEPTGFRGSFHPMSVRQWLGHPFYWHQAQLDFATPARCDVLMLNWDAHYLSLVPAIMKARRNGVATVLWGHGYSRHTGLVRSLPRRALARLVDACVFYNSVGRDQYVEMGLDPDRLFVAPNAIDHSPIDRAIEHWRATPGSLAAFQQERGIDPAREPLLLFVARLTPERRLDLLMDALKLLLPRSFRVAIVGAGDPALVSDLKSRAVAAGVADRLTFIGPCYDEEQLAPWFLSARAFAFPAYIGLSLFHAFAYGLPVVTADNAGANGPEFAAMKHDVNGLLYRDGDAADLAVKLARLLDDESFARNLGQAARRTIDLEHNVDRMTRGLASAARFAFASRQ